VNSVPGRIEDYALIGDLQTAALVGRDGAIDWLCLPRFDSPACFAALLDSDHNDRAGAWRIAPAAGGLATRRRYRGETLIVESEWDTPDGTVRVVDCMPPRGGAADVVRVVEGVSGRVPMRMLLRLRFDYGHVTPWIRYESTDLAAIAGPDAVWLHGTVPLSEHDGAAVAEFDVPAGARLAFVLTHTSAHLPQPTPVEAERAVADTETFWSDWISHCSYRGSWPSEVRRALITLKALTYGPTGGIVAAATTSLPEQLGGSRNWDYRYCWLRDATFTLQALLGTGFVEEARAWREWLVRAVAGDPAELQIMYGLDGTRRLPEQTLHWLSGYENSTPVRSATRPPASSSSTCGARSWTGCTWAGRPGCRSGTWPGTCSWRCSTTWKATGTGPTTVSGRSAATASSSSTPRSWRGPAWTARSTPSNATVCPDRSTAGARCGTGYTPRSAPRATTRTATPSLSSTAPRAWTPRYC
jgi:GH15 family glucan-1,4-alpha-glucosidase